MDWSTKDAKNRFSAVIDRAIAGEPQTVTRRGEPAAVILSTEAYARLRKFERLDAGGLKAHLARRPLVARPKR